MGLFSKAKQVIADGQKDIDEGRAQRAAHQQADELAKRRQQRKSGGKK
jgi:hypothetical protein